MYHQTKRHMNGDGDDDERHWPSYKYTLYYCMLCFNANSLILFSWCLSFENYCVSFRELFHFPAIFFFFFAPESQQNQIQKSFVSVKMYDRNSIEFRFG